MSDVEKVREDTLASGTILVKLRCKICGAETYAEKGTEDQEIARHERTHK